MTKKMGMIILCIFISIFSFVAGFETRRTKDYEAACLFKDVINIAMDDDTPSGERVEEIYNDFLENFENLNFEYLKKTELNDYCWSY